MVMVLMFAIVYVLHGVMSARKVDFDTLNDEILILRHDAFPISLRHYPVTRQSLLFDLSNLRLLNVKVWTRGHSRTIRRNHRGRALCFCWRLKGERLVWPRRHLHRHRDTLGLAGRLKLPPANPARLCRRQRLVSKLSGYQVLAFFARRLLCEGRACC